MTRFGILLRLALWLLAIALLALPQLWCLRFGLTRGAGLIPLAVHRLLLRLLGIRITVEGTPPAPGEAALVLANHVSWLDIPVLGALLPLSFVAKSEIAGWPLVGTLARLQRTVFIDRSRKTHTAAVNSALAGRLAEGDAVVLFAEGTTGDGTRLLPFRASLVGAARTALAEAGLPSVRLQPLTLAYPRQGGLPVTRAERPRIAWYGDMALAPHAAALLGRGPLDVRVVWGEPIRFDRASDRKRATAAAEATVRAALQAAVTGRPPVPAPAPILIAHRSA